MSSNQTENNRRKTAEEFFRKEGVDIVEFKLFRQGSDCVVRITADYPSGGITLADCGRLNRQFRLYLEDRGAWGDDFTLEVISPGLDRKLKTREDFSRVIGRNLSIWLNQPYFEKTYIEGSLRNVIQDNIIVEAEDELKIPLASVQCAKQRIEL